MSLDPAVHDTVSSSRRRRWWREWEVVILTTLVVCAYVLRIGELSIRGEESRWATVAMEMMRTGDWVVPRQQGEPYCSRPPLGNWLIASASLLRGQCDAVAIRLPSVMAVLLLTLLVYAFGRTFMSRTGALAAGLAFASMGEVLQMGRLAESDIVFALLVNGAWITWLWGDRSDWPPMVTWTTSYALAALAGLQKGPQGPTCFCAAVVLDLLLRGEWRRLFTRAHALGLLTFAAIIFAWQRPYTLSAGWHATARIWLNDSTSRFEEFPPLTVVRHLLTYPPEVLGCTAPWSFLLFAYLSTQFRASLGPAKRVAQFLAIAAIVGFVPCWLAPTAMTRYVIPLYPGLALLVGLVVDRATAVEFEPYLRTSAVLGARALIAVLLAAPIGLAFVPLIPSPVVRAYAAPWPTLFAFAVGAAGTAGAVAWGVRSGRLGTRVALTSLATFIAGTYSTIILDGMIRRSEETAPAVARVKATMAGARLVSFDPVHHLFAYHFGEPIELRGEPDGTRDRDVTWFCYTADGNERLTLPFPNEVVAVVPVVRNRQPVPKDVVVVGRRVDRPADDRAVRK
jgi:4-amino-4-deoxy-L-arabinose transferase-like glycosyltransferase